MELKNQKKNKMCNSNRNKKELNKDNTFYNNNKYNEEIVKPDKNFEIFYEKNKKEIFKYIKFSKNYLKFSKSKRDYLYEVRFLYLTVFELSKLKLDRLKNFIEVRKSEINIVKKLRSNYTLAIQKKNVNKYSYSYEYDCLNRGFNYFYIYSHIPYNLFLSKLANILMFDGQKTKAYKILNKVFEILKLRFHILNPIEHLINLLYYNLVPLLNVKVLKTKSKKVIGIPINIEKRLSITLKTFIRGLRLKNFPIIYSFVYEYINLMFSKGSLVDYNKKILNDIHEFKLYRYLKLEEGETYLPENELIKNNILGNSIESINNDDELSGFTLTDIVQIDWKNFDIIIKNLKLINLAEIINFQNCLFLKIKEQIILKYTFISCNSSLTRLPISDTLVKKYLIKKKHSIFDYDFLKEDYLNILKNKKDYIDETKYKAIYDKSGKLIGKTRLSKEVKQEYEYLKLSKVLEDVLENFTRKALVEHTYINPCIFDNNLNVIYKLEDYYNKFIKFIDNPEYFHLKLNNKHIKTYILENLSNYFYFLAFVYELKIYINPRISKHLTEEDYLMFFECRNPKSIDLQLNQEDFIENEDLYKLFLNKTFWRPVPDDDDVLNSENY